MIAFSYPLLGPGTGARERRGEPYGAMVEAADWRFPPAISDVDESDVAAWREAFEKLDHPAIRARLGDLLWERKSQPDPHLCAQSACDAVIAMSTEDGWRIFERVHGLARALELCRLLKDGERQERVIEAILSLTRADLDSSTGGPGISLNLLRPLVDLPAAERPADLDTWLQEVADRYGQDPHITDDVANLRARLMPAEERKALALTQVQRWRREAKKGDTMLRVLRLEHALELAREHGFREQADELRSELGQIQPDELGLAKIATDLEFPKEEVEQFRALFTGAGSWDVALRRLAAEPAPGGPPDQMAGQVDELMAEAPLQFLFPKALIGPDNATAIFRATDPESHRRLAIAEARARSARIWSLFCADALDLIGAREDHPSREDLTKFFATDFVDEELAERFARAVELFWDSQPDECAHVIVPRLEAVFRNMARQLGLPIVREPRPGSDTGGVELLGALLRDLEGAFIDKAWHAYLVNLLVDPLGLNLRNTIAHGLAGVVRRMDAALLVQVALLLSRISLAPVEPPPEPPAGAGPSG